MKKIISICIMFIFIMTFSLISIKAHTAVSDNGNGTFDIVSETYSNVYGLDHYLTYATTSDSGLSDGNQKINVFKMKTDGVNSKMVSWCIQSGNKGYVRQGLTYIAQDYEKNHPGWIVIAGINGDQYFQTYGSNLHESGQFFFVPQPYYPLIIDGERRFAITATGISNDRFVAFANNGQADSFIYPSNIKGLRLEVLDEIGQIVYTKDIDKINDNIQGGETGIWINYNSGTDSSVNAIQNINTSNNLYIIEHADLAYMSNNHNWTAGAKIDTLFAKGDISFIGNSSETYSLETGSFAIETSNSDVSNMLKDCPKVRVQFYYEDDNLNNAESCFGYHAVQRENNTDVIATASYDANRYNRSIFGITADGEYVLMTVARGNYGKEGTFAGTTQNESNAILKYYGVTDAYQQDGGGSVTAIVRNKNGNFDITNKSSDSGDQRSILMGCFFVIRDPGYAIYGKDVERDRFTITRISDVNANVIQNVRAEVNGQFYDLVGDDLTIDGLDDNTTYNVILHYNVVENGTTVASQFEYTITTKGFEGPTNLVKSSNITARTATLEANIKNVDVSSLIISVNNEEHNILSDAATILNLTPNTTYSVEVSYICHDDLRDKDVEGSYTYEFKTLSFDIPYIEDIYVAIEESVPYLIIEFADPDKRMVTAFAFASGGNVDAIELNVGTNKYSINDYSFDEDTIITLNVDYLNDKGNTINQQEDIYTIAKGLINKDQTEPSQSSGKKKGCKKNKSAILISFLNIILIFGLFIRRKDNN